MRRRASASPARSSCSADCCTSGQTATGDLSSGSRSRRPRRRVTAARRVPGMIGQASGFGVSLGAALVVAFGTRPACAQRRPVLDQIEVPHNYYYREMYLPEATSGPGSVSWSPDGRTLVYSMQGSLWKQDVGSTDAYQLTDGPGYDYQPDWSPDGSHVVYASYRGNAEELWAVDVATGATHQLTTTGAVNVEPRWSPDGRRIAWVSTALQDRWHIYVAAFDHDSIGSAWRITTDRDSHLPRYYYSVY